MLKLNIFSGMRNFLLLWAGQSVSSFGTAMTSFALVIWTYNHEGTASSVAFLSVFTFIPSILFCFIAGTLTDKWDKKKVMLISDFIAALGTLTILFLHYSSLLRIWHLYIINFILSFMKAFQNPASYVAVTLITPKELYVRANGLYSFSNSIINTLTPAIAAFIISFSGVEMVFMVDIATFLFAFCSLLFLVKVPKIDHSEKKEAFFKNCLAGMEYLKANKAILAIILFFSLINLLAYIGGNGMVSVLILARTGNNQEILGIVSSAIGLGALAGSILVVLAKPEKNRAKMIFISCAFSFVICDVFWGVGRNVAIWAIAAFLGNIPLPYLNANLSAIMRTKVPIEMQGRVFSTRDTIQYGTIPLGYFLGGVLADHLFEPLMQGNSFLQQVLSFFVGKGKGSGIALLFLITGIYGCIANLLALKNPIYKELDE